MRRRSLGIVLAGVVGAMVGWFYNALSWRYHLPYVGLNWLGPLLGADGEKGYDAMLWESMIDFAICAIALVWLAARLLRSRGEHIPPR